MGILEITPERSVMYIPGIQVYDNAAVERVTPVGGQLANTGITEALLGSDGKTPAENPVLIRPRGFEFDGSDDRITVPNNALLSFGDGAFDSPFSIFTMIRVDAFSNDTIISKASGNSSGEWFLRVSATNQLRARFIDDSENSYIGRASVANSLEIGVDYVVGSTYSGSTTSAGVKLFRDGEQIDFFNNQFGAYTAMEPGIDDVILGDGGGWSNFDGLFLVPPMIFDYELSPVEVAELSSIMRTQYATSPR
jgi:hypothetical protein